eukprot:TRINITY_DN7593_c0_g1_i1.p1 TRINITY_DN7593_c0_g1~~TRINITY_DN7593_c0_g1_i1.p1  ORF type:complete len:1743 (+),score=305.93 TRINITY_DN7593_c0_g1_i1:95-5323(+)
MNAVRIPKVLLRQQQKASHVESPLLNPAIQGSEQHAVPENHPSQRRRQRLQERSQPHALSSAQPVPAASVTSHLATPVARDDPDVELIQILRPPRAASPPKIPQAHAPSPTPPDSTSRSSTPDKPAPYPAESVRVLSSEASPTNHSAVAEVTTLGAESPLQGELETLPFVDNTFAMSELEPSATRPSYIHPVAVSDSVPELLVRPSRAPPPPPPQVPLQSSSAATVLQRTAPVVSKATTPVNRPFASAFSDSVANISPMLGRTLSRASQIAELTPQRTPLSGTQAVGASPAADTPTVVTPQYKRDFRDAVTRAQELKKQADELLSLTARREVNVLQRSSATATVPVSVPTPAVARGSNWTETYFETAVRVWIEHVLTKRGVHIEDSLLRGVADGTVVVELLKALTTMSANELHHVVRSPQSDGVVSTSNLMDALSALGADMRGISAEAVANADRYPCLQLLWRLFQALLIRTARFAGKHGSDALLEFLVVYVGPYPGMQNHKDIETACGDGRALLYLLHRIAPSSVDLAQVTNVPVQNIERASAISLRWFGIPKLLNAEMFQHTGGMDERPVLMFLALLLHNVVRCRVPDVAIRHLSTGVQELLHILSLRSIYVRESELLVRALQQSTTASAAINALYYRWERTRHSLFLLTAAVGINWEPPANFKVEHIRKLWLEIGRPKAAALQDISDDALDRLLSFHSDTARTVFDWTTVTSNRLRSLPAVITRSWQEELTIVQSRDNLLADDMIRLYCMETLAQEVATTAAALQKHGIRPQPDATSVSHAVRDVKAALETHLKELNSLFVKLFDSVRLKHAFAASAKRMLSAMSSTIVRVESRGVDVDHDLSAADAFLQDATDLERNAEMSRLLRPSLGVIATQYRSALRSWSENVHTQKVRRQCEEYSQAISEWMLDSVAGVSRIISSSSKGQVDDMAASFISSLQSQLPEWEQVLRYIADSYAYLKLHDESFAHEQSLQQLRARLAAVTGLLDNAHHSVTISNSRAQNKHKLVLTFDSLKNRVAARVRTSTNMLESAAEFSATSTELRAVVATLAANQMETLRGGSDAIAMINALGSLSDSGCVAAASQADHTLTEWNHVARRISLKLTEAQSNLAKRTTSFSPSVNVEVASSSPRRTTLADTFRRQWLAAIRIVSVSRPSVSALREGKSLLTDCDRILKTLSEEPAAAMGLPADADDLLHAMNEVLHGCVGHLQQLVDQDRANASIRDDNERLLATIATQLAEHLQQNEVLNRSGHVHHAAAAALLQELHGLSSLFMDACGLDIRLAELGECIRGPDCLDGLFERWHQLVISVRSRVEATTDPSQRLRTIASSVKNLLADAEKLLQPADDETMKALHERESNPMRRLWIDAIQHVTSELRGETVAQRLRIRQKLALEFAAQAESVAGKLAALDRELDAKTSHENVQQYAARIVGLKESMQSVHRLFNALLVEGLSNALLTSHMPLQLQQQVLSLESKLKDRQEHAQEAANQRSLHTNDQLLWQESVSKVESWLACASMLVESSTEASNVAYAQVFSRELGTLDVQLPRVKEELWRLTSRSSEEAAILSELRERLDELARALPQKRAELQEAVRACEEIFTRVGIDKRLFDSLKDVYRHFCTGSLLTNDELRNALSSLHEQTPTFTSTTSAHALKHQQPASGTVPMITLDEFVRIATQHVNRVLPWLAIKQQLDNWAQQNVLNADFVGEQFGRTLPAADLEVLVELVQEHGTKIQQVLFCERQITK